MPPSRRFLPALLAVSALLFSGGASSAHAMEGDPPDTAVEVGPDGVGVRTPGALVEIDPGSYVLVCANGVRVKVGVGEAPPCDSSPEPPPVPPPPQEPPPVEPAPEEPPVEPVPEEPVPEEPASQEPVPGEPERRAPTEVEAEPEPVHVAPVLVSEERAPAPVEPSAPPPVPTVTEEVVREQLLADTSTSSAQRPTGAFTPMRTMVVLVVVVAVVAAGAGRAAARPAG